MTIYYIEEEDEEEEEVYLQTQKAFNPTRIQKIICTYMVMAGTVLICIVHSLQFCICRLEAIYLLNAE